MELIRDFQRAWVCITASCRPGHSCLVTNVSVSGAQVRGEAPDSSEYVITMPLVMGTVLKLRAQNIWTKDGHFGLKFIQPTKRDLFLLRALVWAHRREDLDAV